MLTKMENIHRFHFAFEIYLPKSLKSNFCHFLTFQKKFIFLQKRKLFQNV
jgi:hypothetical protein